MTGLDYTDWTIRTGLYGQDYTDWTIWTGLYGLDYMDWTMPMDSKPDIYCEL